MPGGLHPPMSVVLSWGQYTNYVDPPTRGWNMVILVIILLTATYVVVGMRLWARFGIVKNAGIDDALIIFNMFPLTGLAVSLCLAFRLYGFNKHVWDNSTETLVESRKIVIALEALYMVSTSTTKISILLFYRRLAEGSISTRFLYSVYAAIAFVLLYFVVFWINLFLGCRPFYAFWKQVDIVWNLNNQGNYYCFNEEMNLVAAAVVSVLQDFIACGMPMILFWKLKIPMRQKIALGALFSVGFFLCITGVLRITSTIPIYTQTYDMTWESYSGWFWFAIETHLAVICASAPALNIFLKRAINNWTIYTGKSYGSSSAGATNSKSSGSVTIEKHMEKKRRLGLQDTTIDIEEGIKDEPFAIFSSEERLSGSFQPSTFVEMHGYEMQNIDATSTRVPDEEGGRTSVPPSRTFFNDADSE